MDTTAVTTLLSVPAIVALTTLAKRLGVKGPWALLVAVALGAGLGAAHHYLGDDPGYQAVAQGVLLGLSAAGLYDASRAAGTPTPQVVANVLSPDASARVGDGHGAPALAAEPAAVELLVGDDTPLGPQWDGVDIPALIAEVEDAALAEAAGTTPAVLATETGGTDAPTMPA